jgi:glyoxylase-like metal-dependent hydrolase (beta-lactamase superfamily II)
MAEMRLFKHIITATVIVAVSVLKPLADPVQKIHRIDNFGVNIFILETDIALYIIDTGYPKFEKDILKKIRSLKKPVRLILLTHAHFDHFGNVVPLKTNTHAKVAVHQADSLVLCEGKTCIPRVKGFGHIGKAILPMAEWILPPQGCKPDIILHDNDTLNEYGIKMRVVHTPGHTPGSSTFILQDSIAFTGDQFVTYPDFCKQHFYAYSWEQIDSSTVKLLRYPFVFAYAGHREITGDRSLIERLAGLKK